MNSQLNFIQYSRLRLWLLLPQHNSTNEGSFNFLCTEHFKIFTMISKRIDRFSWNLDMLFNKKEIFAHFRFWAWLGLWGPVRILFPSEFNSSLRTTSIRTLVLSSKQFWSNGNLPAPVCEPRPLGNQWNRDEYKRREKKTMQADPLYEWEPTRRKKKNIKRKKN